jgi:hypothetical protein
MCRGWWLLVGASALLGLAQSLEARAASHSITARPVYAVLRFLPKGAEPDVYLRYEKDRLYIASSPRALRTARAIAPIVTGYPDRPGYQIYDFPWGPLPGTTVRAALSIEQNKKPRVRNCRSCIHGEFSFVKKDQAGRTWQYNSCYVGHVIGDSTPQRPAVVQVFSPMALKPRLEAFAKGREIAVGIRVGPRREQGSFVSLTRDKQPAAARVRVQDERGREVSAAQGDVKKFGFT